MLKRMKKVRLMMIVLVAGFIIIWWYRRNIDNNVLEASDKQDIYSRQAQWKDTIQAFPKGGGAVLHSQQTWNCRKQIALVAPNENILSYMPQIRELFVNDSNNIPQVTIRCPKQTCYATVGISWTNTEFLRNSDAFFLHYSRNVDFSPVLQELHIVCRSDATLIFNSRESPIMTTRKNPLVIDAVYDVDVTYHSHSHSPYAYGFYDPLNPMDVNPLNNWAENKTHLVSWMASNCNKTSWPRTDFVRDLQKHIPVDMYGECGDLECLPFRSLECKLMLRKYKFYLSLENSECDEYISDKFWDNAVANDIVPVVYGGRRPAYQKLAPPNSFIHISDFDSTKELADYLLELDKNDTKYNEYFKWRVTGRAMFVPPNMGTFCNLIPFINSKNHIRRKVSESKYYNSCREVVTVERAKSNYSNFDTWSPWK